MVPDVKIVDWKKRLLSSAKMKVIGGTIRRKCFSNSVNCNVFKSFGISGDPNENNGGMKYENY